MGADNLRSFHRWQRWRGIAALVPIAVVDRLGPSLYSAAGAAGQAMSRARIPEIGGDDLAGTKAASMGLPARPQIAALLDGFARGAGGARRLKLLTQHAYLKACPDSVAGRKMERKDKDPCPHL